MTQADLLNQYKLHLDCENQSFHILDLQVRKMTRKRLGLLIQQIIKYNDLSIASRDWVYYGDGKALAIEGTSLLALQLQDARLFPVFKAKMFLNIPFRQL